MIKQKQLLFLAAASLAFAACSTDEDLGSRRGSVEARVSAAVSEMKTRAIDDTWNGDVIGVAVQAPAESEMAGLYRNVKYTIASVADKKAEFQPADTKIFFQTAEDTYTFSAYAPYQETADASVLPGNDGLIAVNTLDKNATEADRESIDFLFATGAQASVSQPNVAFTDGAKFEHKMARLDLSVTISAEDGFASTDVNGISNLLIGGFAHEGTFSAKDGTATATGGDVSGWDITNFPHTDEGITRSYSLIVLPQNRTADGITLSLTIGGQNYALATPIKLDFEAGSKYIYKLTVKKTGITVTGSTISDWENGESGGSDMKPVAPFGDKSLDDVYMGDYYFSDGSVADKDAELTEEQANAVVGLVFLHGEAAQFDDSSYDFSKFTGGKIHGYVVALTDANGGEALAWAEGSDGQAATRLGPGCTRREALDEMKGYDHCQDIWKAVEENGERNWKPADFPAAYACKTYGTAGIYTAFAAPENSTGWFLPSTAQLIGLIMAAGNDILDFEKVKSLIKDENLKAKITSPATTTIGYWSSSEDIETENCAWCIDPTAHVVNIEDVFVAADKAAGKYPVRPILVF